MTKMKHENEIAGVIYPLNKNNFGILKERKDPVYVKFLTRTNSKKPTKLHQGHLLFFYLSGENKSIVGYSKIKEVFFKTPSEIKHNYINRIQMEEEQFNSYILYRETKPLLLLGLDEIIGLKKEIPLDHPLTMTGQYIFLNEMKFLLGVK